MVKLNRTIRDTIFTKLFSYTRYQFQLFQTFHPESVVTVDDIECMTLTNYVLRGMYNDVAILVKNHLMIFVEAQTAWDSVLDYRLLLYWREAFVEWLSQSNLTIHDVRREQIPKVEFYIVYTGNQEVKDNPFPDSLLNAKIVVITECKDDSIVSQYIRFTKIFEKYRHIDVFTDEEKVSVIIDECINEGILVDFLSEHRSEVDRAMFEMFSEEYLELARKNLHRRDIEEAREKARTQGLEEGREQGSNRVNSLYSMLIETGHQDLMMKCLKDDRLLMETLDEYGL